MKWELGYITRRRTIQWYTFQGGDKWNLNQKDTNNSKKLLATKVSEVCKYVMLVVKSSAYAEVVLKVFVRLTLALHVYVI